MFCHVRRIPSDERGGLHLSGATVWGKEVRKGKVVPPLTKDGQPSELWWRPPESPELPWAIDACKAFMRCKTVQPIFVMDKCKKGGALSPNGICFATAWNLTLDPPKKMIKLE